MHVTLVIFMMTISLDDFDDIISNNDTYDGINDDTRSLAMDIIQLVRSFEVNIRICQPEKYHFRWLTNPDVD